MIGPVLLDWLEVDVEPDELVLVGSPLVEVPPLVEVGESDVDVVGPDVDVVGPDVDVVVSDVDVVGSDVDVVGPLLDVVRLVLPTDVLVTALVDVVGPDDELDDDFATTPLELVATGPSGMHTSSMHMRLPPQSAAVLHLSRQTPDLHFQPLAHCASDWQENSLLSSLGSGQLTANTATRHPINQIGKFNCRVHGLLLESMAGTIAQYLADRFNLTARLHRTPARRRFPTCPDTVLLGVRTARCAVRRAVKIQRTSKDNHHG